MLHLISINLADQTEVLSSNRIILPALSSYTFRNHASFNMVSSEVEGPTTEVENALVPLPHHFVPKLGIPPPPT